MPFVRFVLRRAGALVLLCLGITSSRSRNAARTERPVAANLGEQAAADLEAVAASRSATDSTIPSPSSIGTT